MRIDPPLILSIPATDLTSLDGKVGSGLDECNFECELPTSH